MSGRVASTSLAKVRRTGSVGLVALLLGAGMVMVTGGGPAAAAVATWSAPVDLSAIGAGASTPDVALSADGTMATAVWTRSNGANPIVQSASATISGTTTTWSTVTDLSASGQDAFNPRVALTADGKTATAVWSRYDGSRQIVQSASATISGNAADWSGVTNLSAPGGNAVEAKVALSANDTKATAVWERYDGDLTIQTASATISGKNASWSGVTDLSPDGAFSTNAQVAVSANGTRATATWARFGTTWGVQAASATISGNTADWSAPTDLTGTESSNGTPQLALSTDGTRATIAWYHDTSGSHSIAQAASATISGKAAAWSGASDLSLDGASLSGLSLAMPADGTSALAVWVRSGTLQSAGAAISGSSASWSAPLDLPGAWQYPEVAVSADGTDATIVGRFSSGGSWVTGTTRAVVSGSSATWGAPEALTAPGQDVNDPHVALSADGSTAVAIWARYNGTITVVQSATRAEPPRCTVAPTNPRVSPGPDGASLSFTATPSSCIADQFQVRCMPLGVSFATGPNADVRYVTTASLPVVVGTLTSGKTYHCMVREQVTGDSPYEGPLSGWSNDIAISYTTPAAPTAVSAARAASQTVRVSFTPPSNGGATITDYDVQYSTSSTFASGVTFYEGGTTTGPSVDVNGLTNGTTYYFRVRATNLAGNGPWSAISNGAKPYTTPGAPTAVSAGRLASQTVRVSFSVPGSNGSSPITDYDVQYSTDSTFASGVTFYEGGTTTGSSVDVNGLTNGTVYYFQVRATNAAGNGPWSATSNGAKPYTTPDAPTGLWAEGVSGKNVPPQTVRVSFSAPGSNGGATITDYDVQYSTSPTFASGVTFYEGGTTTGSWVDVSGLTGGTVYYFRVRATNAAGNSPWSAISNGTRP